MKRRVATGRMEACVGVLLSCGAIFGSGVLFSCASVLGIDELPPQSSGAALRFVAGVGQSAEVGQELTTPLEVEVRDAAGAPLVGRPVRFAATAGGGYFRSNVIADTDAQGRAKIRWVLGPAARNEVRVTAEGMTATTTATTSKPWELSVFAGQRVGRMFADAKGKDARFGQPDGLTVADGKIYIVDSLAHAIRKFDPGTQDVTTFAGQLGASGTATGAGLDARFTTPTGIVFAKGNLVVSSTNGHLLHLVDVASANVTYLAGNSQAGAVDGPRGTAQFNQPFHLDWDAEHNAIYVADLSNHLVRRVDLATHDVTTLAGQAGKCGRADGDAATGTLCAPRAVAHAGNILYITDSGNAAIRTFNLDTKQLATFAGVNAAGTEAGGFANGTLQEARFNVPSGIVHVDGILYVSDAINHAIRRIQLAGGTVDTIGGAPPGVGPKFGTADGPGQGGALFFRPEGLAVSADRRALYVGDGTLAVRRVALEAPFEVTTVAGTAVVPTNGDARTQAILDWPRGLGEVGGKIFTVEQLGHAVRQIEGNTVTRLAGPDDERNGTDDGVGKDARFGYPIALAADDVNRVVYVAGGDHRVRRVSIDNGETKSLAGFPWEAGFADGAGATARFRNPEGLAIDVLGKKLYVSDTINHRIRVIDLATPDFKVTTLAGSRQGFADGVSINALFSVPRGIAFQGNALYVSDSGNHVIRRIHLEPGGYGQVETVAGIPGKAGWTDGPSTEAQFQSPGGLGFDGPDLLYVADIDNRAIRRIHLPSGSVSTVLGGNAEAAVETGPMTMPKKPGYLRVRPGGEMLFTTYQENVIFRLGAIP